jgi:hypothetical protein
MAKDDTIEAVKKKRRGKPTLFTPEYTEQVEKLCRLGSTDKDLASFFNVSINTIDNWKKRHPDFFVALVRGKQEADSNVAEALYRSAIGFDYYEDHPVKLKRELRDDKGKVIGTEEYVELIPMKKYSKPDTTAQIFHLKNRRPDLWRDVKKIDPEPEMIKQTYRGEAVLAELEKAGFVWLEGEYTIVGEEKNPPQLKSDRSSTCSSD